MSLRSVTAVKILLVHRYSVFFFFFTFSCHMGLLGSGISSESRIVRNPGLCGIFQLFF